MLEHLDFYRLIYKRLTGPTDSFRNNCHHKLFEAVRVYGVTQRVGTLQQTAEIRRNINKQLERLSMERRKGWCGSGSSL